MSIQSEIDRIVRDKEELRLALVGKGAALTAGALLSEFTAAVAGLGEANAERATITVNKNVVSITSGVIDAQTVTIPAGSVTREGIYIKVKEGYVEQTEITLPVIEPSRNGNTVTVPEGWIEEDYTIVIPEASVTENADSVTVGVGYVSETITISKTVENIPQGSVTHEGMYIKVTEGYVENQTLTLPVTEPELERNVFTISSGWVEDEYRLEVPLADITSTGSKVTVGVGYVSEALEFNTGSGGSEGSVASKAKIFCATLIY